MWGAAWLLAAALAPPPPAFAGEIFVVADRREVAAPDVAASVAALDGRELAALPAATLADALGLLPGVDVLFAAPFGGVPMESARGFFGGGEAGYVQLRVDGRRLADPETGAPDWKAVPAGAIERIEVLAGPGSSLYGDTALGGVVSVVTRRGGAGRDLRAGLAAGSFGTARAEASAAGPIAGLRLSVLADADRTAGFRDRGRASRAGLRTRIEPAEGRWTLAASGWRQERQEPGALSSAELAADRSASDPLFRFDREDERRADLSLAVQRPGGVVLDGTAWAARRSDEAVRTLLLAAGFGDRTSRRVETTELEVTGTAAGRVALPGGGDWLAGLEAGRDELDAAHHGVTARGGPGPRLAAAAGRRDRLAAFAAVGWRPTPSLRLVAGARLDEVRDRFAESSRDEAFSPRLGIAWAPGDGAGRWTVFAGWSEAFKAPTLDQRFDPRPFPDGGGGTFTLANPALRPQRAEAVEAGLRGSHAGRDWRLSAYRIDVADEIDFDPATLRYLNLGASRHRGVEAAADLVRRPGASLRLGWEWSRVVPAAPGPRRQLKNLPRHVVRLRGSFALPAGLELGVAARHLAGRHLDDEHRFPLADVTLVDLRLGRAFGEWQAYLDLRNLLDEDAPWVGFAVPDPGGPAAAVPYGFPIHPRAALAGVRWRRPAR